jgi:hypothetical protein
MANHVTNNDVSTADAPRSFETQHPFDLDHATTITTSHMQNPVATSSFVSSSLQIQAVGQTFNFSKLPTELRVRIIHLTFQPQTIVVEFNRRNNLERCAARKTTPLPVALRIDPECRIECQRYYQVIHLVAEEGHKKWPIIYIHPKNDTLKLVSKRSK